MKMKLTYQHSSIKYPFFQIRKCKVMNRSLFILITIVAVLSVFPTPVSAVNDPRFVVYVPEPQLQPGAQQELSVQLINEGEDVGDWVKNASNVKVTVKQGSTPIEVLSGTQLLGMMEDGVPKTFSFRIEVPGNARSGTYYIPLEVTYDFYDLDSYKRETTTVYARVKIPKRPIFEVQSVSSDLYLKETGVVTVTMTNVGSQTAYETSLTITSMNSELTLTGTQSTTNFVGSWEPDEEENVTFAVTASQHAIAKEYAFSVQPTYYNPNDIMIQGPTEWFGVTPRGGNRFTITQSTAEVSMGESGPFQINIRNDGDTTLLKASVILESTSPGLVFDGQSLFTQFVDQWDARETKTVSGKLTASTSAESLQQFLQMTLTYNHPAGTISQSGPYDTDITLFPRQFFSFSNVSVTMWGNSAILRTQVTNENSRSSTDTIVTLQSIGPLIRVIEPTVPIGTLEPSESAQATFELQVDADAYPGVRQFQVKVQYSRGGLETYQSELIPLLATFETDKQLFVVESVNATFSVDSTNQFNVRITNNGEDRLADIHSRLTVTPPYESDSPTSYIAALDPGESEMVTFEVTTPEDAVATTDALTLKILATAPKDQTVFAGPYLVSFTIQEGGRGVNDTNDIIMLAVGAVIVILILGVGWWWLKR